MVLEASMICVDNSEWMRNGDYLPTRMESQADAVNLICNVKTQQNPESTVGVMTMAARRYCQVSRLWIVRGYFRLMLVKLPRSSALRAVFPWGGSEGLRRSDCSVSPSSPEVLVTPSQDLGKILTALHNVKIAGATHFLSAIQVAQLALKHRQNKNQRQRIICFVGSPLEDEQKELVKLGKKLKKNNVAVDVINFGETAENQEKLEAFIGAVNSNENSNLLTVPPGPHILSDIIISSPILQDAEGGGMGAAAAMSGMGGAPMGGDFEYGVDPSVDPELAMALRISAEEERQRQEREQQKAGGDGGEGGASTEGGEAPPATAAAPGGVADEDDLLQQALAMSMMQSEGGGGGAPTTPAPAEQKSEAPASAAAAGDAMDEDDDLKAAMAMSMAESQSAGAGGDQASNLLQDAGFLTNVLSSLPGVDTSDPRVQGVLEGMKQDEKGEEKKDEEKK